MPLYIVEVDLEEKIIVDKKVYRIEANTNEEACSIAKQRAEKTTIYDAGKVTAVEVPKEQP